VKNTGYLITGSKCVVFVCR